MSPQEKEQAQLLVKSVSSNLLCYSIMHMNNAMSDCEFHEKLETCIKFIKLAQSKIVCK